MVARNPSTQSQIDTLSDLVNAHERDIIMLKETVHKQSGLLDKHGSQLTSILEKMDAQGAAQAQLLSKVSESQGENRARGDSLQRMILSNETSTYNAVKLLESKLDKIYSPTFWIAWVIIIVTTSATIQLANHLLTLLRQLGIMQ